MNKRIDFIDLAKGICILMVVMGHSGFPLMVPGWTIVRMPLYFILSGLFFKSYGGGLQFTLKKLNKILIPFLFFYLLSYVGFYLIKVIKPGLLITEAIGILDLFDNRQFFNGPIWFLLALFWCNMFFCSITLYVRKDTYRIILVSVLGFWGWFLGHTHTFLPLFIDVALTSLPFFALGYYLRKTELLYPNKFDKFNLLIAIILWGISFMIERIAHQRLSLHYNIIEGWSTYFLAITSVLSILYMCKVIKKIPFISYIGRYSIILLCIHHMINRPLKTAIPSILSFDEKNAIIAILTVLLSAACIPILKRYLPWFVAQKDLIHGTIAKKGNDKTA